LGRSRQLTSASGRLVSDHGKTLVTVAVRFRGWVIPYLVVSAALLVVIGVVIGRVTSDNSFAVLALTIGAFALLGNVASGLLQQRSLLRTLERILDAHAVAK
jgi:uncharacterized membrane protein